MLHSKFIKHLHKHVKNDLKFLQSHAKNNA